MKDLGNPPENLNIKQLLAREVVCFKMRLTIGLALFVYNKDLLFVL